MNADQALGIGVAQARGDEAAPVAALRAEARVAQDVGHQLGESVGDLLDAEARLAGLERQRVAGKRRRDDAEVLGKQRDQLEELDDRAGPAVRNEQRHGVRSPARLVDEVQLDAADRHAELAKAVDARFLRAPIKVSVPIVDEILKTPKTGTGRPRLEWRLLGPARARQALAQVGERDLGNVQPERPGRVHRRIMTSQMDLP